MNETFAQAGSRPAQYFESVQMFYHSLNGSGPGQAIGGGMAQPLAPAGVMALSPQTRYLLWVELAQGRLNVLENMGESGIIIRKRIPVSIGKNGIGKLKEGDNKTPIGIYRIQAKLSDEGLDDFYGVGAFPLNYPNPLDVLQQRTGHGIWLHGLPKQEKQRPFLTSEGCVVIDNQSLTELSGEINAGATVVLSNEELHWQPLGRSSRVVSLRSAMEHWQTAWQSRNTPEYLQYYADDFSDLHRNKSDWSAYKSRINAEKQFIKVEIGEVNILEEPDQRDVVNVVFLQKYSSDNYHWQGRKQQLWRQEGDQWKIIFEGDYF